MNYEGYGQISLLVGGSWDLTSKEISSIGKSSGTNSAQSL